MIGRASLKMNEKNELFIFNKLSLSHTIDEKIKTKRQKATTKTQK